MTRGLAAVLLVSVLSAKVPKQPFEVTKTERVPFQPGGTVQVENSYGYLTVEGWDEPEVEVTVTKSTDQKSEVEQRFAGVRVVTERPKDQQVTISTTLPLRHDLFSAMLPSRRLIVTMPKHSARGVTVEYTIHVPRNSRVVVHQDHGYVWVSDITGDIEVDSHTGDMIVMLPDPGPYYAIDARTRLGRVSSDFAGAGGNSFLVGARFAYADPAPARRIRLRMGRGSITIKSGPASGPFWKN